MYIFQDEGFTLGVCSANYECLGGHLLSTSSWAVGLGIFLLFYALFMVLGIWMYCKYCRNNPSPQQPKQQLVLKTNSNSDHKNN